MAEHERFFDAVASRKGIYERRVADLEARVEGYGSDAETEELLSAVEELRQIRKAEAQNRPRTAPNHKMRYTRPEPFLTLEADAEVRRRRRYEAAEKRQRAEAEASRQAEERLKRTQSARGAFETVAYHQSLQEERAAAKKAARIAQEAAEYIHFKAKPTPASSKNSNTWATSCAQEEMQREARRQRRAEELLTQTAPVKLSTTRAKTITSRAERLLNEKQQEEDTRKPRRPDPHQVIKGLDQAHDRWCRALDRAKVGGRACTKPQTAAIEKRQQLAEERRRQREAKKKVREEEAKQQEKQRIQTERERQRQNAQKNNNIDQARQTYSTYLKVQAVRERIRREREASEKEAALAVQRQKRLQLASERIRHELREDDAKRIMRLQSLQENAHENKRAFQKNLAQNKRKLQEVAAKAPSLMARLQIKTAQEKARVTALKHISKVVYGSDHPDWKHMVDDLDIFDDEEKILLNIDSTTHKATMGDDFDADLDFPDD